MKILVITDISTNILEKNLSSLKLIKTYENIEKNSEYDIINNNRHFKIVLYKKKIYVYDIINHI